MQTKPHNKTEHNIRLGAVGFHPDAAQHYIIGYTSHDTGK